MIRNSAFVRIQTLVSVLCGAWLLATASFSLASDEKPDPMQPMQFRLFQPIVQETKAETGPAADQPSGTDKQEPAGWRLSLMDVIRQTLENNLDLRIQGYSPTLAGLNVDSSRSIFDPVLDADTRYASRTQPQSSALGGGTVTTDKSLNWNASLRKVEPLGLSWRVGLDNVRSSTNNKFSNFNPAYTASLSFSATQPLLRNFGKFANRRAITVASNNLSISREEFTGQVINKIQQAEEAYWNLLFLIDAVRVQEAALGLAKDLYEINKTRVEVGTMAPLDIAQAEAGVAEREQVLIAARSAVRDAEDQLKTILSLPLDSPLWNAPVVPVDSLVFDDRSTDTEEAIARAMENRVEIRKANLDMANRQIDERYAKNQKKPELNATGGYGSAGLGGTVLIRDAEGNVISTVPGGIGDAWTQIFGLDYSNWYVGMVFSYPIFNRAASVAFQSALLNRKLEEDVIASLKLRILQEVRAAARQVETSRQSVRAARVTKGLQEKKLDAEQKKYQHGLSTSYNVLQFQNDLTTSRSAELRVINQYRSAWIALEKAMGTLLQDREINIADTPASAAAPETK